MYKSNCRPLYLATLFLCICVILPSCNGATDTKSPTAATTTATEAITTQPHVTYIINISKRSRRFHRPSCYSAKRIKDENRLEFIGTREEVIARGYKPCGNCRP